MICQPARMRFVCRLLCWLLIAGVGGEMMLASFPAAAHVPPPGPRSSGAYDTGTPVLTDIWVDPLNGDDSRSGESPTQALSTISAAWENIPQGAPLDTTGYRIMLAPGIYAHHAVPAWWESRYGTYDFPVVIQAAEGPGTVMLPSMNITDCRYLYLVDLNIAANGGDVLRCEGCDHLLIRDSLVVGSEPDVYNIPNAIHISQSQYVYIENNDIAGTWGNAIDFVAVQYGHIRENRIHHAGDWCMYLKGGSAYFTIEKNTIFDCGTGGFTAGQGTSFADMVAPWLHYEAYDIRFVNNVITDTDGPGMGVNGGYNILLAYNTLYCVGSTSHVLEFAYGNRRCDLNVNTCAQNLKAGGWGTDSADWQTNQPIPNRNVFVYNNVLYNPPGYQSQWQHFAIYGPHIPGPDSNIPAPAQADNNLQIRGNVIWNGPANLPLGVDDDQGCRASNPTCNAEQLRAENAINSLEPLFIDPENGDFRPAAKSTLYVAKTYPIPDFPGDDRPQPPLSPPGDLSNLILDDFAGQARGLPGPPGAFVR